MASSNFIDNLRHVVRVRSSEVTKLAKYVREKNFSKADEVFNQLKERTDVKHLATMLQTSTRAEKLSLSSDIKAGFNVTGLAGDALTVVIGSLLASAAWGTAWIIVGLFVAILGFLYLFKDMQHFHGSLMEYVESLIASLGTGGSSADEPAVSIP